MVRKKDAPHEPIKFMGHGLCDTFSKSLSLPEPSQNHMVIFHNCLDILKCQSIKPSDLRGIGIQMTKLCDVKDVPSSSSTRTLFEFATVLPIDEFRKQQQQQLSGVITKSKKQVMNIQRFLQPSIPKDRELVAKKSPPLPNISLEMEEGTSNFTNDSQVSLFLSLKI